MRTMPNAELEQLQQLITNLEHYYLSHIGDSSGPEDKDSMLNVANKLHMIAELLSSHIESLVTLSITSNGASYTCSNCKTELCAADLDKVDNIPCYCSSCGHKLRFPTTRKTLASKLKSSNVFQMAELLVNSTIEPLSEEGTKKYFNFQTGMHTPNYEFAVQGTIEWLEEEYINE